MALAHVAVGGKITAAIINAIIDILGPGQGLIPVIPTGVTGSGAAISAGGLVTLTGVTAGTTVQIQGMFTATYEHYKVFIDMTKAGSAVTTADLIWNVLTGTSTVYGGPAYSRSASGSSAGSTVNAQQTTGSNFSSGLVGRGTNGWGIHEFLHPFSIPNGSVDVSSQLAEVGGLLANFNCIAEASPGAACTGIQFTLPANLTISKGTIRVYGYNNNS